MPPAMRGVYAVIALLLMVQPKMFDAAWTCNIVGALAACAVIGFEIMRARPRTKAETAEST